MTYDPTQPTVSLAGRTVERGFRKEGQDILRALAGGLIFGTPLLYTMEVWFHAMVYRPEHLLILLTSTLLVNFAFSYFAGIRGGKSLGGAFGDAVTSVGLAFALSTLVLWLIGRIDPANLHLSDLAKIALEAVVISVGISFTNLKFGGGTDNNAESVAKTALAKDLETVQLKQDAKQAGAVIAGATVFGFNVAPTDELVLIASDLSHARLLLLLAAELFFCYLLLYSSGLRREKAIIKEHFLQRPWAEVILTTGLSLVVAAVLLFFSSVPDLPNHQSFFIEMIVVLGFPSVVGGALGRLAV